MPCAIGAGTRSWHFCHICVTPRSQIVRRGEYQRTVVRRCATLGADCTLVCGATIGRYAFIGAGAVVRGDVPDYALMPCVPAVRNGWMGPHGHRLEPVAKVGIFVCPETGWRYREIEAGLPECLDSPEDLGLPDKRCQV